MSASATSEAAEEDPAKALDLSPKAAATAATMEDWTVSQVAEFVRNIEGCEEYAEVNSKISFPLL